MHGGDDKKKGHNTPEKFLPYIQKQITLTWYSRWQPFVWMDNDKFISFMEDIIHKPWKKNLNWYVIYLWTRKLYLYQWLAGPSMYGWLKD